MKDTLIPMLQDRLVQHIKVELAKRRWSKAHLARVAGIDPSKITRIMMKDYKRWPPHHLDAILKALDLEISAEDWTTPAPSDEDYAPSFWIYSIYSDAIALEKHESFGFSSGIIGYFKIDLHGMEPSITGATAFHFFDGGRRKRSARGVWDSVALAIGRENYMVQFKLREGRTGPPGSTFEQGGFEGFLALKKAVLEPVVGKEAFAGSYSDLPKTRAEYRGTVYAESLLEEDWLLTIASLDAVADKFVAIAKEIFHLEKYRFL